MRLTSSTSSVRESLEPEDLDVMAASGRVGLETVEYSVEILELLTQHSSIRPNRREITESRNDFIE